MSLNKPEGAPLEGKKSFEGFAYDFTMTELDKEFYADLDANIGEFPFLQTYELDERVLHEKRGDMSDKIATLKYMDVFVKSLRENDITLVQGGTGMGKTVGIARALKLLGKQGLVNVPKREIATGVSNYIYKQFGQAWFEGKAHGKGVGHMVRGNSNAHAHTDVVYLTDAIGIKKVTEMVEDNTIDNKVIVIDEFHERNQNMDILLLALLKARSQGHKFKIVIMSATINTAHILKHLEQQFAKKEQDTDLVYKTRVGLLKFPSLRKHEVYIKTGLPQEEIPTLVQYAEKVAKKRSRDPEQFLVFRQGRRAIKETIMDIQDELARLGLSAQVDVVPMYGSMDQEDLERSKQKSGKPKIIVSTNMLGSGVTLDNLAWVSTNCQIKRKIVRNDFEQLIEVTLSQDEILQELGRGGRTRPSVAFLPHIGNSKENFSLKNHDKFAKPEVQRVKPSSLLFTLATNNLQEDWQDLLDAPSEQEMKGAIQELTLLGLIDDKLKPTELGEQIDDMGLDYRIGIALLEAKKYGKEKEMAALLACQQVGLKPKQQPGSERIRFDEKFIDARSEALTQYNVYKSITSQTKRLRDDLRRIEDELLAIETYDNEHIKEKAVRRLNKQRRELRDQLDDVLQQHKVGFMQRNNLVQILYTYKSATKDIYVDREPAPTDMSEEDLLLTCLLKGNVDKIRVRNTNLKGETHENAPREKRTGDLKIADGTTYTDYKKGRSHSQLTNVNVLDIKHLLLAYPEHFTRGTHEYDFDIQTQQVKKQVQRLFLGLHTDTIEDADIVEIQAVYKFAQTIYRNYHIKRSEGAQKLHMNDFLRAVNDKNKLVVQQLKSLYIKANQKDKVAGAEEFLSHWYCDLLYRHKVYSTAAFEEFLRNNHALLELDSIERIFPDYQKINKKYPDTITFNGKQLAATYSRERGWIDSRQIPVYTVTLSTLDDEDMWLLATQQATITQSFPNKTILFKTQSDLSGYTEDIRDLESYKQKLEQLKKDKARKDYVAAHQDDAIHAFDFDAKQELVARQETVDEALGLIAYYGADRKDNGYVRKIYKSESDADRDTRYTNEYIRSMIQEQEKQQEIKGELAGAREDYLFLKKFFETNNVENRDLSDYLYYTEQKLPKADATEFSSRDYDDAVYYIRKMWEIYDSYQRSILKNSFDALREKLQAITGYKNTKIRKSLEEKWQRCMSVCDRNYEYDAGETHDTIRGHLKDIEASIALIQKEIQGTISSIEIDYATYTSQYNGMIDRLAALEQEDKDIFRTDNELRELLRGFFTIDYQKRHQESGRGGGGGRRDSEQNDPRVTTLPCRVFPIIQLCTADTLQIVKRNLTMLEQIISEYENYEPPEDEKPTIDRNAPLEDQLKGLVDLFKK